VQGLGLDLLAFLHDLLGALQCGHFLKRFLHARRDQRFKRIACEFLVDAHDGRLGNPVEHAQRYIHLLQIRRVALRG